MDNSTKKDKNIHKDHRSRMREKFNKSGLNAFSEHEILEMLLFYTIPRVNTNPIAHKLIDKFGNLARVLDAPRSELVSVEGMGESSALFLNMIRNVANYYVNSSKDTVKRFVNVKEAGNYLVDKFVGVTEERIYIACLDDKGNIVQEGFISDGTINNVDLNYYKISKMIFSCNCTNVILSHNHPTGICKPSVNDRIATGNLAAHLEKMQIKLTAHILVAEGKYCLVDPIL